MNRKSPRLHLLLMVLIGLFVVVGCSSDSTSSKDLTAGKTAKEIAEASYQKQYDAKNYDMEFIINASMMIMGQTINMDMKGYGSIFLNPLKAKLVMDLTTAGIPVPEMEDGKIRTEQYIITENNGIISYQKQGDQWYKMVLSDTDLNKLMQLNPAENLKLFMDNLKAAEIVGDETVNNVKTVKINLTASGEIFADLLGDVDSFGLGSQIDMLTKEILNNIGDLSFSIWVDKTNLDFIKGTIDLTPVLNNLSTVIASSSFPGMEELTPDERDMMTAMFDSMNMTMEYYIKNIDKAEDFKLPPEAAEATELGALISDVE